MTMLEDGAWAVPDIKDSHGNSIKGNFAPEILIKYIAHALKSHIIVFDLLLNRIQFLSGNHLKNNNVVFDSPLLLYTTGGHFQAIFQKDHDFFIHYAKQLDSGSDVSIDEADKLPNDPVKSPKSKRRKGGADIEVEKGTQNKRKVLNVRKMLEEEKRTY